MAMGPPLRNVVNHVQTPISPVSAGLGESVRVPRSPLHSVADRFDMDPYGHRADEIGPFHGIPNVGHLAVYLQPREWRPGQPPLSPATVETLYNDMREHARLNCRVPLDIDDPGMATYRLAYNNQLRLHQLLRTERINVWLEYQKRQKQGEGDQQDRSMLPPAGGRLVTPTDRHFPAAGRGFEAQAPAPQFETSQGKHTPLNVSHLNDSISFDSCSSPPSSTRFAGCFFAICRRSSISRNHLHTMRLRTGGFLRKACGPIGSQRRSAWFSVANVLSYSRYLKY